MAAVRWLLAVALFITACGGGTDDAADATSAGGSQSSILDAGSAPPGTTHVATVSWDDVRATFQDAAPGELAQIEALGFSEASLSVFVGGAGSDELVDLAGMGRVRVSGALTFDDAGEAATAVDAIDELAGAYVAEHDAALEPFDTGGVVAGALGVTVDAPTFPGGAAAIVWVDGDDVMLAFAQGGDAGGDVLALAEAMRGGAG